MTSLRFPQPSDTVSVVRLLLSFLAFTALLPAQDDRMSWFRHDKFGMFIHFGPYSALAGEWNNQQIPPHTEAEWIMQRFNIPVAEYRERAHQFNPAKFNAEAIVALAKATGMKYLVVTAKHHDGFAMYHSAVSKYNIVDWTPFHRDIVKELSDACQKAGKYAIKIRYAAANAWKDGNYVITVGTHQLKSPVKPTGDAYQYQTFDAGSIVFPKAGQYKLQLNPAETLNHYLMYFDSLTLEPLQ